MARGISKRKHSSSGFRARNKRPAGLAITSMLDILTTILFFLLKNYSYIVTNFNVSNDLRLPESTNFIPPPDSSLNLIVTKKAIILDGVELVQLSDGRISPSELHREDNSTITKLAQALQAHKKRSKKFEQLGDGKHQFSGLVVLQADKTLKYQLIKKVIHTAGITDFVGLKLAVLRQRD